MLANLWISVIAFEIYVLGGAGENSHGFDN